MAQASRKAGEAKTLYSITGRITDLRPGRRSTDRLYGRFSFRTVAGEDHSVILYVPPSYVTTIGDELKIANDRGATRLRGFFIKIPQPGSGQPRDGFIPFKVVEVPEVPEIRAPAETSGTKREVGHRFGRAGFWRRQRCGKGRSEIRMVYVGPTTVRPDLPARAT